MVETARRRCSKCGRRFRKGGSFYVLKAELISFFDGYIRDSNIDLERRIDEIEKEVEGLSEERLEEQVYKKFEYFVCSKCRDEIDRFLEPEGDE